MRHWMLGALLPLGAVVAAQEQAGSVRGSVSDQDFNVPLAGVLVQVVETGQRTLTSSEGNYAFPELRPGSYTLSFSKEGYLRAVRSDIAVSAGQLTDLSVALTGEFTEMDEFVVQELLPLGPGTEVELLRGRLNSASIMDSIGADTMRKAGVGDAVGALRLVAGASVQGGKYAVIRGLPDRYVSSQMNGVRLPSADENKRAVELDQFPTAVMDSIQVTKTFTPDQQGDASGGAVDIRLKGIPSENTFQIRAQPTLNSQSFGQSKFLDFDPGDGEFQPVGQNWDGDVGVSFEDAPIEYKWSVAAGGKRDLTSDLRIGGFLSLQYDRDTSFFDDGVNDSWYIKGPGQGMTPEEQLFGGALVTSLYDISQATDAKKWAGLATLGLESDTSQLALTYLFTRIEARTATLAEDTRGKEFYFPGYDPNDPNDPGNDPTQGSELGIFKGVYNRQETLEFARRSTRSFQLHGKHQLPGNSVALGGDLEVQAPELSWTVSTSNARLDQPDKRQFGSYWLPSLSFGPFTFPPAFYPLPPSENVQYGNLQRVWKLIDETSHQVAIDLKFPFTTAPDEKGYLKTGLFHDAVERDFSQDSFTNNISDGDASFQGGFDEFWSASFPSEPGHEMGESLFDVDYHGTQDIAAWYGMLSFPLRPELELVGGLRFEDTHITVVNQPEADALWFPNGGIESLDPGEADVDFAQDDVLPAVGLNYHLSEALTLRASYSQTVARQTFKELSPIIQQEFLGGPIFIGNPDLQMSALTNYDLRLDYSPAEDSLLSASLFYKDVTRPIEYVQDLAATFSFTTATNYPEGQLRGIELEARQGLGHWSERLEGFHVGANATLIDSEVHVPQNELDDLAATGIVSPDSTRAMTNAPDHLFNLFLTYELPELGTDFGLFYTLQGESLVAGEGTNNLYYIPAVFAKPYDTLNFSVSQKLGEHVALQFQLKNITNPDIETVYRSDAFEGDVTKTSYSKGIDWLISLSVNF